MRKLKVVLVEDEEIVLRELEETIDWEGLGLEVVGTAKDGIEGENMIKALSPDIVVTDIKLPGKNGLQMIEDAAVTNGIILSGYTDFEFTKRAIRLGVFDYLFTDAMTIVDHKGRLSRIYRPEEVRYDGITKEQYMDCIVDQTVKILTNEPADIFANPTYIPDDMNPDYARYWTDERVERVLDVLEKYDIALEINARYRIPSFELIRQAQDRGIQFTFGTNNVDADFGRLEDCVAAIEQCGLTPDDLWFPSMSVRRTRPVVIYNDL